MCRLQRSSKSVSELLLKVFCQKIGSASPQQLVMAAAAIPLFPQQQKVPLKAFKLISRFLVKENLLGTLSASELQSLMVALQRMGEGAPTGIAAAAAAALKARGPPSCLPPGLRDEALALHASFGGLGRVWRRSKRNSLPLLEQRPLNPEANQQQQQQPQQQQQQ
ncbi:hypothetical protein, conserved [Eimeria tenella]|uniref:Uncharacterized protein n=1 Tax=Eimeria tenella TaxID=5802 RepID=U6KSK4_EIMTE|nr:hypothetical protein, conserved [Eimeria tenella]CDJ38393.1 hypothetical protein, conserved [Eimeria tenella]|eukprot:XP_013229231.1 hypothetical protein, conserved [Eimeria tenella]